MAQIIISCAQTSMLVMRNVHLGGFFRTILLFMYFFYFVISHLWPYKDG